MLAGLGLELDADTKALEPAWTRSDSDYSLPYHEKGHIRLPYYYHWEFGTGLRGDFEHLVRLLEPRKLVGLGIRDIGCEKPGFGTRGVTREGLDEPEQHYLGLEGALQSLNTRYTWWGRYPANEPASPRLPEPLQEDLAALINIPEAQRIVVQFTPETLETSAIAVASTPDDTSVQFTWRTSMPCKARIDYGTTDAYGQHVAKHQYKQDHRLSLPGLTSGQAYHFKITLQTDDGVTAQSDDRTFTMPPVPSVVPPIYGWWHAARQSVDPHNQEAWIEALNLDPRHRTAAGFGADVVRKQQEPLMASA